MWKRLILLVLLLLTIVPISLALTSSDWCIVNEQCELWFDCVDNNGVCSADAINISIYDPTGSLLVGNVSGTQRASGLFSYNYSFNDSGVYYAQATYYDSLSVLGSSSQSVSIRDIEEASGMSQVAIILGFMGFLFFLVYMANKEYNERGLHKIVGAGLYIFSVWIGTILFFYVSIITDGTTVASLFDRLFVVVLIIASAFTLFFIAITLLELLGTSLGTKIEPMDKQ